MITRSQIRRQLRSQGGIMNVVGRQKYGLGSFVKKAFGKAKDVVSSVVKSPVGKAAIIGLGGAGLMGMGPLAGLGAKIGGGGGLGSFFGRGSFNPLKMITGGTSDGMLPSLSPFGKLLSKAGLTKSGGSLSGLGKIVGAGGLISYFTGKGKTEEEAKELAQDVYRGEGLGLDLIKADIQKYRSGESSEADMFAKGYNFLVPRSRIQSKDGGIMRVKLEEGTPSPKAGSIKRMTNEEKAMQKQAEEAMMEGVIYTDPEGNEITSKEFQDAMRKITEAENMIMPKRKPKKAQGGRIGFGNGSPDRDYDDRDIMEIMKDEYGTWDQHDADYYDNLSKLKKKKTKKKKKRVKAYGGGVMAAMPRIPTGMPRVNAGGVGELDYRQEGGFVPVGVKEKADDVPAMLSKNEFVMTADAVRGAGNGSIEKGAQRMYDTMKQLEGKMA